MKPFNQRKFTGVTLVELAIVLVIVGLLITLGMSLIGPLTKRAKVIETRETLKAAKEAVTGFAVKNGYLPNNLNETGAKTTDAWMGNLTYVPAPGLNNPSIDLCGYTNTNLTINICKNADCSQFEQQPNIAFIIYSKGEDRDGNCTDRNNQYFLDMPGKPYNTPGCQYNQNGQYRYDDIVVFVTLDELKALRGCIPLQITSPTTLDFGYEDKPYTYTLQAKGGKPPYTWTLTSSNWCGLSNSSTGTISGTINCNPATNTGELNSCTQEIQFTATVRDSSTPNNLDTKTLSIPVHPQPLRITTDFLPYGFVNSPYSATLYVSGGVPTYTWTWTPTNPAPGLTCTQSGNNLTISGTPTQAGTYNLTVTVSNNNTNCNRTDSRSYTITIYPQPQSGNGSGGGNGSSGGGGGGGGGGCTSLSLSPQSGTPWTAQVNSYFSQNIIVIGGQPQNISCGQPCFGLVMYCTDSGATISGTPNTNNRICTFSASWRNQCNPTETITGTYTVTIGCPQMTLNPTPGTIFYAQRNVPFSQTITVQGGRPPITNIQCSPQSCRGLTLSCSSNSATISGTPNQTGLCTFNVRWRDSCNNQVSGTYRVRIN